MQCMQQWAGHAGSDMLSMLRCHAEAHPGCSMQAEKQAEPGSEHAKDPAAQGELPTGTRGCNTCNVPVAVPALMVLARGMRGLQQHACLWRFILCARRDKVLR